MLYYNHNIICYNVFYLFFIYFIYSTYMEIKTIKKSKGYTQYIFPLPRKFTFLSNLLKTNGLPAFTITPSRLCLCVTILFNQ